MINFTDPNDVWYPPTYDPYKGLNDEDRDAMTFWSLVYLFAGYIVAGFILLLTMLLLNGCASHKNIPVTSQHTEHHWHTDTVRQRDSVHTERQTIIRELDSLALSFYGIRLQASERAWLVQTNELRTRLQQMERLADSRDTVHDTIPLPYPVEVVREVDRKPSVQERIMSGVGTMTLFVFAGALLWWLFKRK